MTLSTIRPPGRLFSDAECEAIAHRAAGIPRSTPPVENSNPEGGPKGADGQGACTTNPLGSVNRDKTGMVFVKKNLIVDFDGVRFRVQRVRLGIAYGETLFMHNPVVARCSQLRVVA